MKSRPFTDMKIQPDFSARFCVLCLLDSYLRKDLSPFIERLEFKDFETECDKNTLAVLVQTKVYEAVQSHHVGKGL